MRYIEIDSIIEQIKAEHCERCTNHRCTLCDIDEVLILLEEADDADVVEVKHGKWKEHFSFGCWHYDCPFCDDGYSTKEQDKTPPNHCPNCGAKMDERKETIAYTKEKHSKEDVCGITHLPCCYCQPVCGSKKTIKFEKGGEAE